MAALYQGKPRRLRVLCCPHFINRFYWSHPHPHRCTATTPVFNVIIRRVFGVAGGSFTDHSELNTTVAWPSGDWGSLPVEGGLEAAFKRVLAGVDDPDAVINE